MELQKSSGKPGNPHGLKVITDPDSAAAHGPAHAPFRCQVQGERGVRCQKLYNLCSQ